jgi:membrane protease YdiL (CAAX protease family)
MTEETAIPPSVRPLGWWRFLLQLVTVLLVYLVLSTIPLIPLIDLNNPSNIGRDSTLWALSAAVGMAGALLVAWFWLRRDGAVSEAFNFARPESWRRTLAWALAGTGIIIAIFTIGADAVARLNLPKPQVEGVIDLATESPAAFALWITLVVWGTAAFGEEMLWRGFLMDRLSRLAGLRGRMLPVLLIQAFVFGLAHGYQDLGGVLITGSVGLFLGWLRLHMGGKLWACIIAHGLVDTIMLSLGYAEALGWYGT